MSKTHQFTENTTGLPITVVIDKIKTFKHDNFSECTNIVFIDGSTLGVSETIEDVTKVVEGC